MLHLEGKERETISPMGFREGRHPPERRRCPGRGITGREAVAACPAPTAASRAAATLLFTLLSFAMKDDDVCVCAVLIVPLRFLCHCGKRQLCSPALEGANGPGGGRRRARKTPKAAGRGPAQGVEA